MELDLYTRPVRCPRTPVLPVSGNSRRSAGTIRRNGTWVSPLLPPLNSKTANKGRGGWDVQEAGTSTALRPADGGSKPETGSLSEPWSLHFGATGGLLG